MILPLPLALAAPLLAASSEDPGPGRWFPNDYRPVALGGRTEAERAEIARLEALGYLGGYEPGRGAGVTLYDRGRSDPGVNLYSSGHAPVALLLAMDGRVLHRWSLPFAEAFPSLHVADPKATGAWRKVALRPSDGHLLAVFEGVGLVHLDARSELVWATANRAHHDARWREDGSVIALTRILHAPPDAPPLLEDFVAVLDARGREQQRVSVPAALAASPWRHLLDRAPTDTSDRLHTNAAFPLDGLPTDPAGIVGAGRVLLSMRHIDALAVLDLDEARIVWAGTGSYARQHDVALSGRGEMWLFDNRGGPDGTSRALALEPFTDRVIWSYGGTPDRPLSSRVLGAVQALPNGNVLVTESTSGRAIEVTRSGDPVWVYTNPAVTGENDAYIAAIFDMERLPLSTPLPWIRPP